MCTAIWHDGCFGRTLDLDRRYSESVTVTPRRFPLAFSDGAILREHHALIGMATVAEGYPLYYEAMNEHGLCMAGLRFREAVYHRAASGAHVASYELILRALATCSNLEEARTLLSHLTVTDRAFNAHLSPAPLHWLIADHSGALAAEPLKSGLKVWDDPTRVLTNDPHFEWQTANLARFANLSPKSFRHPLTAVGGLGSGAQGLPGDWSSASRFVRAAFAAKHTLPAETDTARVATLFRLLGTVSIPHGCVLTDDGHCHTTVYTCCCDTIEQTYHYTTATDARVVSVPFTDRDGDTLTVHMM